MDMKKRIRVKNERARAPEYQSWSHMKSRCQDIKNQDYHRYGGRGITVCKEWEIYENFLADMGRRPSSAHSLDRIENNSGYHKGNCKWSTKIEQNRNKRNNRLIEYQQKIITLSELSEKTGIPPDIITYRLKKGWGVDRAVETQVRLYRRGIPTQQM